MGMKTISISKRLHRMIVSILLLSLVCTIVTWILLVVILEQKMNGANHYEQMIPEIEKRLKVEGERILEVAGQSKLEQIVPAEGFDYKVVDHTGSFIYGTVKDSSDVPAGQLIENLNRVGDGPGSYFVKYSPIIGQDHTLQGVLLLYYKLKMTPINASDSFLLRMGSPLFLLTPFVYIILFTILFVRRLSKEIKEPLEQLMVATAFIREKDLQFSLSESGRITEIKLLIEAFEEMKSELGRSLQREWKLQQERKESIAALAHDIRTPLTIIQGHIEGLEEAKKKGVDRFDRYLSVIKSNSKRAVKLVHDLNQTAVLENDSFRLNKVDLNPVIFLDEKMMEYEYLCAKENVRFSCDIKDERDHQTTIQADPDRLSQVLDNLLSNSLRFAQQGEIRFQARLFNDYLCLKMSDDGPGFEQGMTAKVFHSFYQGRTGTSRRNGHAGLGLYIAKTIIEKHDGEIRASNDESGGAVITIRIPSFIESFM